MNEIDKRKITDILRKIDILKKDVENLLKSDSQEKKKNEEPSESVKQIVDSIGSLSTSQLEEKLHTLGHKELGYIFVNVGGSSGDKRKPKIWLMERIIWLSKSFSESHRSIRES